MCVTCRARVCRCAAGHHQRRGRESRVRRRPHAALPHGRAGRAAYPQDPPRRQGRGERAAGPLDRWRRCTALSGRGPGGGGGLRRAALGLPRGPHRVRAPPARGLRHRRRALHRRRDTFHAGGQGEPTTCPLPLTTTWHLPLITCNLLTTCNPPLTVPPATDHPLPTRAGTSSVRRCSWRAARASTPPTRAAARPWSWRA